MRVMKAVNDTNEGEDDQITIRYDEGHDAFLIHDPNYPEEGPEVVAGHDIIVDGQRRHVYAAPEPGRAPHDGRPGARL